MLSNEVIAKRLAESVRKLNSQMEGLAELTGWEIYNYFDSVDEFIDIVVDLIGMIPDDTSSDDVIAYLDGDITFDVLLVRAEESAGE